MKKIVTRTLAVFGGILVVILLSAEITGGHIPSSHNHPPNIPKSICWGYAQGRAFGKVAGDAECDPVTTYTTKIDENYFTYVGGARGVHPCAAATA